MKKSALYEVSPKIFHRTLRMKMTSSESLRRVFWEKFTDVSEVLLPPSSDSWLIALMVEAANTPETSVNVC
jgi:hypothetical protein